MEFSKEKLHAANSMSSSSHQHSPISLKSVKLFSTNILIQACRTTAIAIAIVNYKTDPVYGLGF